MNYWIFQANPSYYKIVDALRKEALKSFIVKAHKDKIKVGDKVILWVTGKEAGCYALLSIISGVEEKVGFEFEKAFYTDSKEVEKIQARVGVQVDYNLWKRPISKNMLSHIEGLKKLKVGSGGSSFKASKSEYNAMIRLMELESIVNDPMPTYHAKTLETRPLNRILYGPPGTGKTYNSVNYALAIIEDKSLDALRRENRKLLRKRFNEYRAKGQIETVTFHQAFAYEDFVEGIKPKTNTENQVYYEIEDGVFKHMANNARKHQFLTAINDPMLTDEVLKQSNFYKVSFSLKTNEDSQNTIFDYCIKNDCITIPVGDDIDFSQTKNRKDIQQKYMEEGRVHDFNDYPVTAIKTLLFDIKKNDIVFVVNSKNRIKAIGLITSGYFFKKNEPIDYHQFRPVQWLYCKVDLDGKHIYQKQFLKKPIYGLDKTALNLDFFRKRQQGTSDSNRYVLIIDEINRGNIAHIFGELITLIEPDKRSGCSEAMSLQLPYSKTEFSVPPNLYIVGTMNTADRSIEALDTALRRRFTFTEMSPRPSLLDKPIGKIDLSQLLETMNRRIERLIDLEHCIGHAYFLSINSLDELRHVFRDKILPLLQEYFYNDYAKIGLVLGRDFVQEVIEDYQGSLFADFDYEDVSDFEERKVYRLVVPEEAESFVKIYR